MKRRIVAQVPMSFSHEMACNYWHTYMKLRSGWRLVL